MVSESRDIILDIIAGIGVVSVLCGCWWIYPPAALIVFGSALVAASVIGAKR